MANSLRNNYIFRLTWTLTTGGTTVTISNDLELWNTVSFTDAYIIMQNRQWSSLERMKWSASWWTLTLSLRWLDQSDSDVEVTALKKEWKEWTKVKVTILSSQLVDRQNDNEFTWNQTFSGRVDFEWASATGRFELPSYTTAERDALAWVENWELIYNETTWEINQYVSWAWTSVWDTGTPNASETVAGKVEIATTEEAQAWTDTGWTWATLVVKPSDILNVSPSRKSYTAWEDIPAAWRFVYVDASDGKVYMTDSEDANKIEFIGATNSSASADASVTVNKFNDGNQSWLTIGSTYYLNSTQPWATNNFALTWEDTTPRAAAFKSDWTKMYTTGTWNNRIYQYSLSTAWDVSSATYDSVFLAIGTEMFWAAGIHFKPDWTSCYVTDSNGNDVYQYDFSTAWDLSTASYASKSLNTWSEATQSHDFVFNDDGTVWVLVDATWDTLYEYTFSTAYDISTWSYSSTSFDYGTAVWGSPDPRWFVWTQSWSKAIIADGWNDGFYQFSASTPYDISTLTYDSVSLDASWIDTQINSLDIGNSDGTLLTVWLTADDAFDVELVVAGELWAINWTISTTPGTQSKKVWIPDSTTSIDIIRAV